MDIKSIYNIYEKGFSKDTFNNIANSVWDKVKDAWTKPLENNYLIQASDGKQVMLLDIIGEEKLSMHSDVTDYYVESNTSYQDQISLAPKQFSLEGEVGELVFYQNDTRESILGLVSQKLQSVISFLPKSSKSMSKLKSNTMKLLNLVEAGDNLWSKITSLIPDANKQQQAYIFLDTLRETRMPVNVRTPWTVLSSYVVTDIELTQPKTTREKTLIKITFKEFKTAKVITVKFDAERYQGDALSQNSNKVDLGTTSGEIIKTETANVSETVENGETYIHTTVYDEKGYEWKVITTSDKNALEGKWYRVPMNSDELVEITNEDIIEKATAKYTEASDSSLLGE